MKYQPLKLPATDPTLALDCWYLTGPTASGKTTVGIELARRLGAEIISLDSMAVYRGMDIGTAKPTAEQRRLVAHHLLDIADPADQFSAFQYVERAEAKIAEIRRSGHEVLFVGGTPLYLKALLRGLFRGPAADWDFRRQIEEEIRTVGQRALYERLAQVDPVSAARLHPNDTRRLVRALEVYKLTGQPISHWQMQFDEDHAAEAGRVFVIERPRGELRRRIHRRVESMFASGLVDEVRSLTAAGKKLGRTASQAVGYREVIEHLAGRASREETVERVKVRTRRFAKRQGTWFRSLAECRPVTIAEEVGPDQLARRIVDLAADSR